MVGPSSGGTGAAGFPGDRRRMLFVDDDENLVVLARHALRGPFELLVETSGEAAARRLEHDPDFDVVVCDLMMSEVDGVEVYERATRAHPELAPRFVFTTGGAFTDRTRGFLARVPNRILEKPFRFSDIEALLPTSTDRGR